MTKNNSKLLILLFFTFFPSHHTFGSQTSHEEIINSSELGSILCKRYRKMFPDIYAKKDNHNTVSLADDLSNSTESISHPEIETDKKKLLEVIEKLTPNIGKGDQATLLNANVLMKVLQQNHRHALLNLIPEDFLAKLLQHGNLIKFYGLSTEKLEKCGCGKPERLHLMYYEQSTYEIEKHLIKLIVSDQFYQALCSAHLVFPDVSQFYEAVSILQSSKRGCVAEMVRNYHGFNLKLIKAICRLDQQKIMEMERINHEIVVAHYLYFCAYYSNPLHEKNKRLISYFTRIPQVVVPNEINQIICLFLQGCIKKDNEPIDPLICDKICQNSNFWLKQFETLDIIHNLFLLPSIFVNEPSFMEEIGIKVLLEWCDTFLRRGLLQKRCKKETEEDIFEWEIYSKNEAILHQFYAVFSKFLQAKVKQDQEAL